MALTSSNAAGTLPFSVILRVANADDATMFEAVLDDIPRSACPAGGASDARASSTPTRPTTIAAADVTCAGAGSARGSPAA